MKYIFFDIDNTLVSHVNGAHIPNETRKAINLLKSNGHEPAIATGRGSFLSQLTAKEFGIDILVCSGGAEIFYKGKKIFTKFLNQCVIDDFMKISEKFPEVSAAADENFLYTNGAFNEARIYFNNQAGYDCVRPLSEMKQAIICYIMLPPNKITHEYGFFYPQNHNENIKLELMNNFVEVRPANLTKWHGIEFLINHIGANINDVITVGDGPNDVEMLKNAPLGIAVGKSHVKAKNVADFITDDIDEGGILKVCYDLNLINQ